MSLEPIENWFKGLKSYNQGLPARGSISGALVVVERLKENFDLNLEGHTATKGRSQIKGASGAAVAKILHRYGETRKFNAEGGRTNRGLRGDIETFLDAVKKLELNRLSVKHRASALEDIQRFLVERVQAFFNLERIKFVFDPQRSTEYCVGEILRSAKQNGKAGQVAQHLVGAKLQLRFPDLNIGNESYSTADAQTGRPGDFLVGETSFHVTVAPMQPVFEKCVSNIDAGLKTYLIVPGQRLEGARQIAEDIAHGRIAVVSLESFVGFNVDEVARFGKTASVTNFLRLIEIYNVRVEAIESDRSLMIEIPTNLKRDER